MHAHTGVAWLRMKMNREEPSMPEFDNGTNVTQIGSPGVAVANAIPVTHQASHRQLQLAIGRNLSMKLRRGHESRTEAIQRTRLPLVVETILGMDIVKFPRPQPLTTRGSKAAEVTAVAIPKESGTRTATTSPDETLEVIAGITETTAAGMKPGAQSLV